MLGKFWRLRFLWVADQTLTFADGAAIAVRMIPWKLASGALSYGTVITDDMGFTTGTIVTTGESEGDKNDNTSDLYWGVKGFFKVTADLSSTDGNGYLYLEESDATADTNWPSDQADFDITKHMRLIGEVELSTDAVDEPAASNFEF